MAERRIRFDERAANDVRAAVEWYSDQQSDLGQEFLAELDACMQRCVRYPDLHQAVASSDIRRALLDRFPFAVYYRLEDDDLVILAVAHTARDPEFWRGRMEE